MTYWLQQAQNCFMRSRDDSPTDQGQPAATSPDHLQAKALDLLADLKTDG